MKKKFNIEVDCANCAQKMEEASKKVEGVKSVSVNFVAQTMKVEFTDGIDDTKVMREILATCKKIEPDCEIEL